MPNEREHERRLLTMRSYADELNERLNARRPDYGKIALLAAAIAGHADAAQDGR